MARLKKEQIGKFGGLFDFYVYLVTPTDKTAASELLMHKVVYLFNDAYMHDGKVGPFSTAKQCQAFLDIVNARANHLATCEKRHISPTPVIEWATKRKVQIL